MRLQRTILLGMAFAMGKDPFATYSDLDEYQKILDEVTDKLIACKANIKTYWTGGDDLSNLMLSGEVVASETWDSTAFKLYGENKNIVFIPPETGALAWIDTFAIPPRARADDAAYKWINFVLQPENVTIMSASHRRHRRRQGRYRAPAGRQEGRRQCGLRRRRYRQPEVLRQHPGRGGGHGRQGARADQGRCELINVESLAIVRQRAGGGGARASSRFASVIFRPQIP